MTRRHLSRCLLASLPIVAAIGGVRPAAAFEFATGIDVISDPQTRIEALHRFYVGRELGEGWHLGQAIYSAAAGDAGGAFFWGFEGMKDVALTRDVDLRFAGFVGGGGGASEVTGDGLMLRGSVGVTMPLWQAYRGEVGLSFLHVDGAEISDPALSLGVSRAFATGSQSGGTVGAALNSVALRATGIAAGSDARWRSGAAQGDMGLAGAELTYAFGAQSEVLFAADGAFDGAEGYMQILSGLRHPFTSGPLRLSVEGGLGLGGGGDVDTGSGWLGFAGLGAAVPLSRGLDLQASVGRQMAFDGAFEGDYAQLRLARVFRRAQDEPPMAQRWQVSAGVTLLAENDGLRKPGSFGTGDVLMQESSLDLFVTDRLYVSGNAQTTMAGDVSGFAIGLLGLGYEMQLAPGWTASVEAHVGAAGGGGVETRGGGIGSLRAELDYSLSPNARLSLGLGQMRALGGDGGMAPPFVNIGLKLPFATP